MRIKKVLLVLVAAFIVAVGVIAVQIYTYADNVANVQADAAIVLGAALWGKNLSPVFRERVNHAIQLYRSRKVRKLIFTGAQGSQNEPSESAAARRYAVENGVPSEHRKAASVAHA